MRTIGKLFICLVLSLIVTSTVPAAAQGFNFKWWQTERFQKELKLAPEQITRIEGIFQASAPLLRSDLPLNLPAGWDFDALFNRKASTGTGDAPADPERRQSVRGRSLLVGIRAQEYRPADATSGANVRADADHGFVDFTSIEEAALVHDGIPHLAVRQP